MTGAGSGVPLRVRVLHRSDSLAGLNRDGHVNLSSARGVVARDLAGDVVQLLSSGVQIAAPPGEESDAASGVQTRRKTGMICDSGH